MFESSLAVLVTNVHQEKNKHLIGQIVEVGNKFVESLEGINCFFSLKGKFQFNVRNESVSFSPDVLLDIKYCEILEVLYDGCDVSTSDWEDLFQNVEVIDD